GRDFGFPADSGPVTDPLDQKRAEPCSSRAGRRVCRFGGSNNPQCFTGHYRDCDPAGTIGGHRVAVRRSSRSRPIQLFGSGAWNISNWPVGHLTAADDMELVCDGYDDGGSVYTLYGAGKFTGQYIAAVRGQRPEHTNACNIDRRPRGHARAWHDWSIRRPNCAFDRLAVACGLDTRRAEKHRRGRVRLANSD